MNDASFLPTTGQLIPGRRATPIEVPGLGVVHMSVISLSHEIETMSPTLRFPNDVEPASAARDLERLPGSSVMLPHENEPAVSAGRAIHDERFPAASPPRTRPP